MSKVLDYLMRKDVAVVFDIDGVLAPYEFDELHHSWPADDWENYVINNKPYSALPAIPQLKKFIEDKNGNVYACSVAEDYEKEDKGSFVTNKYGIPKENIIFVEEKPQKMEFMKELAQKFGGEDKVALVEDTVKTLDAIYETSDFITVHISSFFFYEA